MARQNGKVARWMAEKGFGFLTPDDGGKDVFVHHSAIVGTGRKDLSEGERVSFEVASDPKGPRAVDVTRG